MWNGKMEGDADQLGGLMKRICDVFARMDLDNSDSIEMSELEALGYSSTEAKYLMSNLDSDQNGSISCNELVEHFLNIKKKYGLNKVMEHCTTLRRQSLGMRRSPRLSPNLQLRAMLLLPFLLPAPTAKKDLPSTWLPILTARVNAVFKRIDMDGNNSIDKNEILALQHGNKKEACGYVQRP